VGVQQPPLAEATVHLTYPVRALRALERDYLGAEMEKLLLLHFTARGASAGIADIAEGAYHSCVVVNGAAWCWGDNFRGDLGNNSQSESDVPVEVYGL
jgi:hypothetical protein